mmetsp:Transcript_66386/g.110923  ORF Transcript_66386/g.110923 Transcript_66386/m.110923 type:complete len:276 (+) Transcript_66386:1904-2731(+)
MIMTSGMWFSTASIMTRCCSCGDWTCMRRAEPMAGWGMSPSPPISFEVSTITTRILYTSDSCRATSRKTVVLPTPGGPRKRMEVGVSKRSLMMSTRPEVARPTRQVSPIMPPNRLRMALMRCSVPGRPARLSPPKAPRRRSAVSSSSAVTIFSRRLSSPLTPPKRAKGCRPRSNTTSSRLERLGWLASVARTSFGSTCSSDSMSSSTCTRSVEPVVGWGSKRDRMERMSSPRRSSLRLVAARAALAGAPVTSCWQVSKDIRSLAMMRSAILCSRG